MDEVTQEVKRSELYNEIYAIVRQIPMAKDKGDCMDARCASMQIEKLVASRDSRQLSEVPSEEILTTLKQLSEMVPMPPKAITYENGVEIVDFVQDKLMPTYYNFIKRDIAG